MPVPGRNEGIALTSSQPPPTLAFQPADSPFHEKSPIPPLPRGRHGPTNSLSTIPSFDTRPAVASALDGGLHAHPPRGRTRAGTMPSRFGAPGAPLPKFDEPLWSGALGASHVSVPRHATDFEKVSTTYNSGLPSLPDGFRLLSEKSDADALGETQELSLAKTLDYLGLGDEPRPVPRERARTDASVKPALGMMESSHHLVIDRFLQPELLQQQQQQQNRISSATSPAPPMMPTQIHPQSQAPTKGSSQPFMSRAPGFGRLRSGTVAAMSGPDGRQRTELELQRAYGMMTPDALSARVRSNSAHLHSSQPRDSREERNLYITRLSTQASTRLLLRLFEPYGMIEDILLFPQHGAASVQFEETIQAEQAAEAGTSFIGAYLMELFSDQSVMPHFAAGMSSILPPSMDVEPVASRVIQVSALPPGTTQSELTQLFLMAGPIEHVAAQPHAVQITFERIEDARTALQLDASLPFGGAWPLRVLSVSEEDIWPRRQPRATRVGGSASIVPSSDKGGVPLPSELAPSLAPDQQREWLKVLRFQSGLDPELEQVASPVEHTYATSIPLPADGGRASRRMDHAKYRELRKTLEAHRLTQPEVDQVALEQLDVIVELARNYIGNTVVQRFFEQCSESAKTRMLEKLAPHLASIGTHKNGTWAAQKIIDCVRTEEQQDLIVQHMQPYVPPLLLDQFGNYVVQCVLPFGFPKADFIMDAMVDRCWEIAQGRFGARSMRTCLEHPDMPRHHVKRVALAIILHCVPLSTSSNGALLLTWLFESSGLAGVSTLVAPRFVPFMSQMCTHKLASGVILRILSQTADLESARLLLQTLFDVPRMQVLEEVLLDPVHGVLLVSRALLSPALERDAQVKYSQATAELLQRNDLVYVPAYRRLAEQVGVLHDVPTRVPTLKWDGNAPLHPPPTSLTSLPPGALPATTTGLSLSATLPRPASTPVFQNELG